MQEDTRGQQRHSVEYVYNSLGPYYFRTAFRMSYESFMQLASLLQPVTVKCNYNMARVNGPILPTVRLSCAISYFAGGSPYDIATTFGVGPSEVFESIWEIVDAVNNLSDFDFNFPKSHQAQQDLARGFNNKSQANIDCCVGAADGILIWIHKPKADCCTESGCDERKFYCARKHKFGLICQAVCDSNERFLDMSILYPGSTADCLAFEGMTLYHKLEDGLPAPNLCLFGDNAYLNAPYMAKPNSGTTVSESKDDNNFFHSQLRIQIECSLGKFTQRWGLLRSALHKGVSVKKAIALVVALGRLHNFCIDQNQSIGTQTAQDARYIVRDG